MCFSFPSLEPNSYSFLSCIIIHRARNAEKGGWVLTSIILPNLNHSFYICTVPVPVPFLDSGFKPYTPKSAQMLQIFNTLSNTWWFYMSMGNPSGVKGLNQFPHPNKLCKWWVHSKFETHACVRQKHIDFSIKSINSISSNMTKCYSRENDDIANYK